MMQKPTPQLKVFIISWSEIFLDFNNLNILVILICERLIFKDKLSGIDYNIKQQIDDNDINQSNYVALASNIVFNKSDLKSTTCIFEK